MQTTASHPQGKGCRLLTPTVVVAAAVMLETRTAAVTGSKVMSEERGSARTHFRLGQAGGPGVGSWFQLFFFCFSFLRGSYRGFDQQDSGNGTAGDPRSFSVEGGRIVGRLGGWGGRKC